MTARPYDLTSPTEVRRLFTELHAYLVTCQGCSTDPDGRRHALRALEDLLAAGDLTALAEPEEITAPDALAEAEAQRLRDLTVEQVVQTKALADQFRADLLCACGCGKLANWATGSCPPALLDRATLAEADPITVQGTLIEAGTYEAGESVTPGDGPAVRIELEKRQFLLPLPRELMLALMNKVPLDGPVSITIRPGPQ